MADAYGECENEVAYVVFVVFIVIKLLVIK